MSKTFQEKPVFSQLFICQNVKNDQITEIIPVLFFDKIQQFFPSKHNGKQKNWENHSPILFVF